MQMKQQSYNMDHVHHILEPVPDFMDSETPLINPNEIKDFEMLWSPRYSAMEAWSLAVSPNSSEVRMTQRKRNQQCFLPISVDEEVLDICTKEGRLFITITDSNLVVLYSVLFCQNESLFDISGLLDSIVGEFDDDFIAKVRELGNELKNVSMHTFALKVMRLYKSLNGVRPKTSDIRRASLGTTFGTQMTPSASTVTP